MKKLNLTIAFLTITLLSFAQKGYYVKYTMEVKGKGEQAAMMESMMTGSTMEIAMNKELSYVKNTMGALSTSEIEMNTDTRVMTMYMYGMMGKMAFQGNLDSLNTDDADTSAVEMEFFDETKTILGYECKKATSVDPDGNRSVFWYTEDIKQPEGTKQMPNTLPGLALEMETSTEMGDITYKATEFKKNPNMKDYKVTIPEDVEIQSFEDLKNMGMGGM